MANPTASSEQPPERWTGVVRHVTVVGLAGLTTGVTVGGVGSRIFMRIAGAAGRRAAQGARTEAGFTVGEITFGGTLALVLFVGLFVGIAGAALYAIFRPWLAWAGRLRGAAFGVVLFAVGSASSDVMNPDNVDFFILGNGWLNVLMIFALFLAFGVAMEATYQAFDRRVPPGSGAAILGFAVIAVLGLLLSTLVIVTTMFGNQGCDCDPPIVASWFTLLAGSGTALWWVSASRPRFGLPARIAGYVGLLGAAGFGLVRALSDAAEIVF